jgi:flagellar FliL protein
LLDVGAGEHMADAPVTASSPAPKGASMLVPALLVVNLVLVAAVLALSLLRGGVLARKEPAPAAPAEHAAKPAAQPVAPGPSAKLSDFVVHLRDAEADRYARMSFEIEVGSEEDRAKLGAFMPRIRDAFIAFLSDRTLAELRGSDALKRTKGTLEERLKELAPGVAVRALYVTDLVIQ